jgi:hypothetical protein
MGSLADAGSKRAATSDIVLSTKPIITVAADQIVPQTINVQRATHAVTKPAAGDLKEGIWVGKCCKCRA